jgi:hypothetical protein
MSRADIFREALRLQVRNKVLAADLVEAVELLTQVYDYGLRPERVRRIESFLERIADHAEAVQP